MSGLIHVLAAAIYVGGAFAFTMLLAALTPDIGPWTAYGLGFGLLLAAVGVHLLVVAQARRNMAEEEVLALRAQHMALRDRIGAIEDRLDRLERSTGRSTGMIEELKALQQLLARVADRRDWQAARPEAASRAATLDHDDGATAASTAGEGGAATLDVLRAALEENRVEIYLQPIVRLPQRKPALFEAYSRLRAEDGTEIMAEAYLPVAEAAGLIATIDNLLLLRCVQLVRRNQHRRDNPTVLVNISPHSLNDAAFFTDFIDYMLFNRELSETLVFEFPAAEFLDLAPETEADLARLAEAGFRFSLDRVQWWPIDPGQFAGRHVGYLKLDAATLQEDYAGDDGPKRFRSLQAAFEQQGIALVAEKIEAEDQLLDLLDLGIDYGQGYLFGEPMRPRSA